MSDAYAHERIDDLARQLLDARLRIGALETEVRELRSLVTPLDTGSLPPEGDGSSDGR